jgi:rare lipoprotein A
MHHLGQRRAPRPSPLAAVLLLCLLVLSACGGPTYKVEVIKKPGLKGTQQPYKVNGQRYDPLPTAAGFAQEGIASWYGKDFHGRKTSNGEIYDMYAMTAAHKTLPMNVHLRVTNRDNGRSTVVRVNDRGPFVKGRIIDLSYVAAKELGVVGPGTAPVRIEALGYREQAAPGSAVAYRQPATYDAGQFMVQVGAFTVPENAQRLAGQLQARFGQSAIVEAWVNGRKFYRVRAGLYLSLDAATAALAEFADGGYPDSFVVARE